MDKNQALNILGLQASATENEIKKKFRKLAKEKHPDTENGNEEEYKKISAAYEYLKNPPPEPSPFGGFGGGGFNIQDFIRNISNGGNGFNRSIYKVKKPDQINIDVNLSFEESVLGTKKSIEFERTTHTSHCANCRGTGFVSCTNCDGNGAQVQQHGNMFVSQTCQVCMGSGSSNNKCTCTGTNVTKEKVKFEINLPGGIINGQHIALPNNGNINVTKDGLAQGDLILNIHVKSNLDMKIVNGDVISTVKISLHDALIGITKKVKTVKGEQTITIKKETKHKDEIKLYGHGVNGRGNHIFVLNVEYPSDIAELIKFLKKEE